MADGTTKPISEIKAGDEVANTSPDGKTVEHHKVTAVHSPRTITIGKLSSGRRPIIIGSASGW
jgi:3-dehydroquinate synthase class II